MMTYIYTVEQTMLSLFWFENRCVILYVYIYHVCPVSILHVANWSSSMMVTNDALCSLYWV